MENVREGGCQCGAVRYRIVGEPLSLAVCHCSECQRQSGSAFGMSLTLATEAFHVQSGKLKMYTRTSESGRPVVCAFCPDCGTRIYHEPAYLQGMVNLKPGTLDDTSSLQPALHVWTEKKQNWVGVPDGVRCFERQPF